MLRLTRIRRLLSRWLRPELTFNTTIQVKDTFVGSYDISHSIKTITIGMIC